MQEKEQLQEKFNHLQLLLKEKGIEPNDVNELTRKKKPQGINAKGLFFV